MSIVPEYPNALDKRGTAEVKVVTAAKTVTSGLNKILDSENKVDPSLFSGGGAGSENLKPTIGNKKIISAIKLTLGEETKEIAGLTYSFTVGYKCILTIYGVWQMELINYCMGRGRLYIDGSLKSSEPCVSPCFLEEGKSPVKVTTASVTKGMTYRVPLEAGSHTVKVGAIMEFLGESSNGEVVVANQTNYTYLITAQ